MTPEKLIEMVERATRAIGSDATFGDEMARHYARQELAEIAPALARLCADMAAWIEVNTDVHYHGELLSRFAALGEPSAIGEEGGA